MNSEEIIEMAREAGFKMENSAAMQAAKAFAKLVAAKAIAELESQEPIAYVNVENRRLEFATDYVKWDTPTTIKLDKIPLYTPPPQRIEQNFCPRCGKRTNDIHTCTPPMEKNNG